MDTEIILRAEAVRPHVYEIDSDQALRLINEENAVIIDVQDPATYRSAHLPAAINMPLATLPELIYQLKWPLYNNRPLLLYCTYGVTSVVAADILQKLGFEDVYSLRGGFPSWEMEGLPMWHHPIAATAAVDRACG